MSRSIPIALLMLILASANAAEPSASKEPSADREPSASKEPSADREPSAYEEPSADNKELSALVCSGCHGGSELLPDLGQYSAAQINSMMLAFRTGQRESTLMGRLARGYSEDEIAAMARALGRE